MTELSPITQAVLTAFRERYTETLRPRPFPDYWQKACLAAAFTALTVRIKGANDICKDVFDIADELETFGLYVND